MQLYKASRKLGSINYDRLMDTKTKDSTSQQMPAITQRGTSEML
jgi:hypothetical protein